MRIVDEGRGRQKATDPLNRRYWKRLESREQRYQDEAVDPVYTRLDTLLTPLVRGVLCQRPTFDLTQLMNEGQILICNLNKGAVGELNSHLLGAFIVSGIVQAAFNRSPQFHQRRFYVFADEFQNYATDSFATGLSEARKVGLVFAGLAHQYLGQLPESVRSAVFGNTGTTVVFRVGAEDASLLAAHTGGWVGDYDLPPAILKELPNYHCVVRVLRGGVPYTVRLETPPPPEPVHDRVEQLVRNSRTRFGKPRALVERAISSRLSPRRRKRERKW